MTRLQVTSEALAPLKRFSVFQTFGSSKATQNQYSHQYMYFVRYDFYMRYIQVVYDKVAEGSCNKQHPLSRKIRRKRRRAELTNDSQIRQPRWASHGSKLKRQCRKWPHHLSTPPYGLLYRAKLPMSRYSTSDRWPSKRRPWVLNTPTWLLYSTAWRCRWKVR